MMKPPVPCQGDIEERSAKAGYYSRTPRPIASKELTYQDHARRNLRTVRPGKKGLKKSIIVHVTSYTPLGARCSRGEQQHRQPTCGHIRCKGKCKVGTWVKHSVCFGSHIRICSMFMKQFNTCKCAHVPPFLCTESRPCSRRCGTRRGST